MPEQWFSDGPDPTPVIYTVPGAGDVSVYACYAEYDGTGAAGAFVPALRFRSQAGHTIDLAEQDTAVAAGGSAICSWFPQVGGGAAGTSSALITAQAFAYGNAAQITALNTFKYIDLSTFITSDSSAFTTDTVVIGGTTFTGVVFLKQGTYWMWANGVGATGGTPANPGDIVTFTYDNGGDPFGFFQGTSIVTAPTGHGSGDLDSLSFMEAIAVKSTDVAPPTTPLVFKAKNATGARGRVGYNTAFMFAPDVYPFPGL